MNAELQIVLQSLPFFPNSYLIFQSIIISNIQTKSQLENLSKYIFVNEVLSLGNFQIDFNNYFNNFQEKYERANSNLLISRSNELLFERIKQLERKNVTDTQ